MNLGLWQENELKRGSLLLEGGGVEDLFLFSFAVHNHASLGQLVALRAAASGAERGDVDGRVGALSLTARAHLRRAVAFRSRLAQLSRGASSSSVASSSVASVALGGSVAGGLGAAGACDGDSTLSPPKTPSPRRPLRSWPTRRRDGDDVSGNVERCAVQDSEPAGKQIPNTPFSPYVASPFLPHVRKSCVFCSFPPVSGVAYAGRHVALRLRRIDPSPDDALLRLPPPAHASLCIAHAWRSLLWYTRPPLWDCRCNLGESGRIRCGGLVEWTESTPAPHRAQAATAPSDRRTRRAPLMDTCR